MRIRDVIVPTIIFNLLLLIGGGILSILCLLIKNSIATISIALIFSITVAMAFDKLYSKILGYKK